MRRIKSKAPQQRDYEKMLKDYFGYHLYGLWIEDVGGQIQAQVIYMDFKHIDTVRKELAQMMPEVEFVKLYRDFTMSAQTWALRNFLYDDKHAPVIFEQRGDTLVKTSIENIARGELQQLELDEDDEKEIGYDESEKRIYNKQELRDNSME